MSALPAFDRDPYLTELDSEILRIGQQDGRSFAVLGDTVLYPEGGGQPGDRGWLGAIPVLDVQKQEGEIRHVLASPVTKGPVRVKLDWPRRFDHMQQHTGQHLLTAVAQERFGWETKAFHLGEARCDIELSAPAIRPEELDRLEEAVAGEIRAGRAVAARFVTPEEYASMTVRSRGLPEGHRGGVRLVEIEGLDLNTCGGTHLRSTAELELVKLLGTEPIRGGTRLFFAAGLRARSRMGEHERRNAALRTLLGAPDEELVPSLEAKLEQLKEAERRIRALEDEITAAVVESLSARSERILSRHFEGKDAGFIQKAARQLVAVAPGKVVFFTAGSEGSFGFVLAAGEAAEIDVARHGKEIALLMEAKGGGAKGFFQGRAASLARRSDAMALLDSLG